MARLFSKDYHDKSNSWYFNHAVILLEEGDLWYWHTEDESANVLMRFFPINDKREYFSSWVEVLYDPEDKRILSYDCAECGTDEGCRHYLSLLRYAYNYISDDVLKEEQVQTCDSDCLRANLHWMNSVRHFKLFFEGIFNPATQKIRIYHEGLNDAQIPALMKILKGQEDGASEVTENLPALDKYQIAFLESIARMGLPYSTKNGFWSIPKAQFPNLLFHMEHMAESLIVRETNEPLQFAGQPYPLALRIEKYGKDHHNLVPVLIEELSAWYAGYPTWLFFRNKIHKVWLPFKEFVVDSIFQHRMQIKATDLPYYRSVVHTELARRGVYLDFDASIELPRVLDSEPRGKLYLREMGDEILIEGYWVYEESFELPMEMLKYGKPLVYSSYRGGDAQDKMWFYLPDSLKSKTRALLDTLPPPQINQFEQNSQLVYKADDFAALQKAVFQVDEQEWELIIAESLNNRFITKIHLEAEVKVQRAEDIDWFSYEVSYRYKDLRFSHDELFRYFKSSDEFLHTVDGRMFFISNPQIFSEIDHLLSRSTRDTDAVYRARILNLPYYQRLKEENPAFKIIGDDYLENMFEDLKSRTLKHNPELPSFLQTILRGYQKAGVAWINMLKHYRLNGILADEMGLGKTIQALALIANTSETGISMVVCPKTLLYNWAAEIEKFHTNIPYAIIEGNKETRTELLQNPNIRLYIISYSMVLSDFALLKPKKFEWLILDEAQNIKNVSAQRTRAIKKLDSAHRLALSGTPIENNMTELWSIMDFLMPGYLGSIKNFKDTYLKTEEDKDARAILHRLSSPFLLRRIKKEVLLELPDKQEQIAWCKMSPIQEKLYLQILETVQKKLMPSSAEEMTYVHILAALTKLRQVCNHPHLANNDILPEPELSAKLEMLVELVQDAIAGGHKVLIFSQFVQMLKIMRTVFDNLGIPYSYLDGKTKDRAEQVRAFETNESIPLFLISLKTGGTGLNLTSADTVILYDPWWNPMVENQAIDRTHRIGQTRKVQVFRLITKATVEEKILSLQQNKIELFNEVIEGGTSVLKSMSLEELKSLFDY
jgi:SNF2 family DNA or RNA helicase